MLPLRPDLLDNVCTSVDDPPSLKKYVGFCSVPGYGSNLGPLCLVPERLNLLGSAGVGGTCVLHRSPWSDISLWVLDVVVRCKNSKEDGSMVFKSGSWPILD